MLNNFATLVQHFVQNNLKTDGVNNCQNVGSENRNFRHCSTCVILPLNTLHYSDVIVNKKSLCF